MLKPFLALFTVIVAMSNFALAENSSSVNDELEQIEKGACRIQYDKIIARELRNRWSIFFERILLPAQKIEPLFLANNSAEAVVTAVKAKDYRRDTFPLETTLFIYQDWFKKAGMKKEFANLLADIKAIEDQIGQVVDMNKNVDNLTKLGLPKAAIDEAQKEAHIAEQAYRTTLDEKDWIGHEPREFEDMVKLLKKFRKDVPTQEEDLEYLENWFHEELEWLQTQKIDVNNLQNSFHEFRRRARRLLIAFSLLLGKAELVAGKATLEDFLDHLLFPKTEEARKYVADHREKFLKLAEESKKYLSFESSKLEVKHKLYVDRDAFYTLGFFVTWIGSLKDDAELHVNAQKALVNSGLYADNDAADQWLVPHLEQQGWKPYQAEGQIAIDWSRQSGVFKKLFIKKPKKN